MKKMVNALLRSRQTPIGLDVGANGYRAARLRGSRGQFTIEHCLHVDARVGSSGGEDAPATFRRIREDLRGAGFGRADVVTSVAMSDVEFHLLEVPTSVLNRPESEAAEAVRWEVARGVNGSIDDFEVRHWLVPASSAGGPTAVAVSVRRKMVSNVLNACGEAGLGCCCVDPFATALTRLGCLLRRPDGRSIWGIMDVGLDQSRLVLCVDDVPVMVRNVGAGGQTWTEQISESLQLSAKAAEVQKRDHGIGMSVHDAPGEKGALTDQEVGGLLLGALRTELAQLTAEIKRSYEYMLTFHNQRQAGELLIVGGGARLKHLPEYLAGALGIPVLRASDCLSTPGCRLECPSTCQEDLDSCALAVGLAVWGDSM